MPCFLVIFSYLNYEWIEGLEVILSQNLFIFISIIKAMIYSLPYISILGAYALDD